MRFHPRMRLRYYPADLRVKPCPKCEGRGGTIHARATFWQPEDSEACEECGGACVVTRRVNVYRKRCHNVAFLGLSDSYEQFYQAVRRCWRFGQAKPVDCHIVTSDIEGAVVANIQRKESDAARMAEEMVAHMHAMNEADIRGTVRTADSYEPGIEMVIPDWLRSA